MVTTLHTPPTPWLESALAHASPRAVFVAVSRVHGRRLARSGRGRGDPQRRRHRPLGAGTRRRAGRLGGRLVAREGAAPGHRRRAPGRDAAAARGSDARTRSTSHARSEPRLGDDVRYVGHLDQRALCELVGGARGGRGDARLGRALRAGGRRGDGLRDPGGRAATGARCARWSSTGGGVVADPHDPGGACPRDGGRLAARPRRRSGDRRRALLAGADGRRLRAALRRGARAAAGASRDRLLRPPPRPRPPAPGPGLAERVPDAGDRAVLAAPARGVDRRLGAAGPRRRRHRPARGRPRADTCTGRPLDDDGLRCRMARCRRGSPSTGPRCSSATSRSR